MNKCCDIKCSCLPYLVISIIVTIIIIIITMMPKTFGFSFKKVDSSNNNPLDGATFELKQNDTVIVTATSENGGIVTFSNLKPGEYVLVETIAPDGYTKDTNSYNITIANDGTVTYDGGNPISNLTIGDTPSSINYAVIYKSNSEPPSPPAIDSVPANTSYEIKDNPFSYPGYVFKYWNTEPDGSGTTYNPGDIITVNSSITLYAIWEKVEPSEPPTIDPVKENAPIITGTGIPGSTITVKFPNGTESSATVKLIGTWTVQVPANEQPLMVGTTITAYQTEVGKGISNPTEAVVSNDEEKV